MKLVLVNHKDHRNINSFSGIAHFMSQAIKKEFEEVIEFNEFEAETMTGSILQGNLKSILYPFGKNLTKFIKSSDFKPDFIFCQGGNTSIPYYDHSTPIAYWHDSTWNSIWRNYEDNSDFLDNKKFKVFKTAFSNLYLWDKKAMERADLVIFSSNHVAEAACRNYKISEKKIKVIPFGANLANKPNITELKKTLTEKIHQRELTLTFAGKDWERKGLIKAVYLTNRLNSEGIPTKLNIIGCNPTIEKIVSSPYVNLIGYIDKSVTSQFELYESILRQSHFLIHPALAEPFGIVLCEANAFGVPVIGTTVDGLQTIVSNGKNGFLFKKNRFIHEASEMIKKIFLDMPQNYSPLFNSTLVEFNKRLNWEINVKQLKNIMQATL